MAKKFQISPHLACFNCFRWTGCKISNHLTDSNQQLGVVPAASRHIQPRLCYYWTLASKNITGLLHDDGHALIPIWMSTLTCPAQQNKTWHCAQCQPASSCYCANMAHPQNAQLSLRPLLPCHTPAHHGKRPRIYAGIPSRAQPQVLTVSHASAMP